MTEQTPGERTGNPGQLAAPGEVGGMVQRAMNAVAHHYPYLPQEVRERIERESAAHDEKDAERASDERIIILRNAELLDELVALRASQERLLVERERVVASTKATCSTGIGPQMTAGWNAAMAFVASALADAAKVTEA